MSEYKGAWHGDPALKAEVLARMIAHREADEIIQMKRSTGARSTAGGLVDCMLSVARDGYATDWATWARGATRDVARLYAIPYSIVILLDDVFEDEPTPEAATEFAVASIEAIQVGADLLEVEEQLDSFVSYPPSVTVLELLRNAPLVAS